MILSSTHSDGFISGVSYTGNLIEEMYCDTYDVMVLVSSWDRRSICITGATQLKATKGILVLFDDRDQQGLRDNHDQKLLHYCEFSTIQNEIVVGRSTEVEQIWGKILDSILSEYIRSGRPLSLFIDASTCPRYYTLGILGYCLKSGIAHRVTISYAEAL